MEANTAGDYHSSNPFKNNGRKDQGLFRKNSSMSTANQHQFQINTPSALGYTSVLFGGANQLGHYNSAGRNPGMVNFNLYGNLSLAEEQDLRTQ